MKHINKRNKRPWKYFVMALSLPLLYFTFSTLFFSDPLSRKIRQGVESGINGYIERINIEANKGVLKKRDKRFLKFCVDTGIFITRLPFPEGAAVLKHYIYGKGEDLELPSKYFQNSSWLKKKIAPLSMGDHGPIGFSQHEDWRLSLALNPFYLRITEKDVTIYHPVIEFSTRPFIYTIIPLGKLKIKVYDNLINIFDPQPFKAYARWKK